jgi:hypothetical protein
MSRRSLGDQDDGDDIDIENRLFIDENVAVPPQQQQQQRRQSEIIVISDSDCESPPFTPRRSLRGKV